MPTIAQQFNDGTVTIQYDDGTISTPIRPVGTSNATKGQHLAHVLLGNLKQANAAQQAHKDHLAHVAHVQHVEHVKTQTAKELRFASQPSFFGLYKSDYSLAQTLSALRNSGASPKDIYNTYRSGVQARRNEAEISAQYLDTAASFGFSQKPTADLSGNSGSSLSDILGSATSGFSGQPPAFGSSLFDNGADATGSASATSALSPTVIMGAAGVILLLVLRKKHRR